MVQIADLPQQDALRLPKLQKARKREGSQGFSQKP